MSLFVKVHSDLNFNTSSSTWVTYIVWLSPLTLPWHSQAISVIFISPHVTLTSGHRIFIIFVFPVIITPSQISFWWHKIAYKNYKPPKFCPWNPCDILWRELIPYMQSGMNTSPTTHTNKKQKQIEVFWIRIFKGFIFEIWEGIACVNLSIYLFFLNARTMLKILPSLELRTLWLGRIRMLWIQNQNYLGLSLVPLLIIHR